MRAFGNLVFATEKFNKSLRETIHVKFCSYKQIVYCSADGTAFFVSARAQTYIERETVTAFNARTLNSYSACGTLAHDPLHAASAPAPPACDRR